MDLENIKIGYEKELSILPQKVSSESFEKLRDIMIAYYEYRGINLESMNIVYQRFSNSNSVLAIKLVEGENADKENYMFVGATPSYYNGKVQCDVYMHAEKKCANEALELSRQASRKIVEFFQTTEKDLVDKNITDSEFAITIPLLTQKKGQSTKNKDNSTVLKKTMKKISTILWKK